MSDVTDVRRIHIIALLDSMSGYAVVFKGSEAHHSLKQAGWSEADEQPIDNLRIMEW